MKPAFYPMPPENLGSDVWARWDGQLVRRFNLRLEQIAMHVKRESGFSRSREHIVNEKINTIDRDSEWLLHQIENIGARMLH